MSDPTMLEMLGIDPDCVDWWQLAKCRGMDTNIFYDKAEENSIIYENVKQMCESCPVKKSCLAEGIKFKGHGIWGGVYLQLGIPKKLHGDRKK